VVEGRPISERAVLPVAVRRAINEARVDLVQPLPPEGEPRPRLRPHIVHQNIALPDQSQQHRRRIRLLQVEHERALIAVKVQEHMAHLAVSGGLGIAHDVAARRLDLDYLGAEVAEDLRRERPKYHSGEVEYLDAGEGSRLGFTHRVTFRNLQSKRASNISSRCICSKSAAKSLVKVA